MDYFDMLNRHLLRPLMEGDVKGTIQSMDEYCVTRTDLVEVLNAMVLGEGKYRFTTVRRTWCPTCLRTTRVCLGR